MPSRNRHTALTPEQQERLTALRYQVKRFEDKGMMNTAAHEMLARLESELGLTTNKKDTREPLHEVNDGKSNI